MPPPLNLGYVGPVSALIDSNNVLTVNWVPNLLPPTAYTSWEIILNGNPTASVSAPVPYTGTPLFYTTTLAAGSWTMDMRTTAAGSPPVSFDWEYFNSTFNVWESVAVLLPPYLAFPDAIPSADVIFSNTTLQLGQPLTLTLQPAYTNADQWQVLWPDGSNTGWLPLSASLLTKQFSISGPLDVVIQTRKLYNTSSYSPQVILMRQLTVAIFVVDQQFTGTTTTSTSLTGTLGIGGQQGFEITGATGVGSTANPWEVVARAIVRDTDTNELKLLVATTRFSNASSLLGTMGIDVFPIEGRPKVKELIVPVYENSFNSLTSAIPVSITTTQLPTTIYVGKPMAEFQMQASGGNQPYAWYTDGLPEGLKLSVNGVLSGTPLGLGNFSINFAVQDSSVPFFIAETAFPIKVSTDLLVQIAPSQSYTIFTLPTVSHSTPLSPLGTSLGVAQVDTPYSVQMVVGNVNTSNPTSGGLPPYSWLLAAGNLPIGLSINPNTGLISGTPCTYNSTTDYSKTFSAVVQVTDAIGAIATQTYTMTLQPAPLQFAPNVDQSTVYAGQQFKLVLPIFGGIPPYTLTGNGVLPVTVGSSSFYSLPALLVDGQLEVDVNFDTAGTYTFLAEGIQDSATPTHTTIAPAQFTLTVETALSDPFLVPALVNHVWGNPDVTEYDIPITGTFSGFSLADTTLTPITLSNGIKVIVNSASAEGPLNGSPTVGPVAVSTPINYGFSPYYTIPGIVVTPVGVNSEHWYARFVGYLMPSATGTYTIGVNSDDGANVFVGGQTIVRNLNVQQPANNSIAYSQSGTVSLTAGIYYPLVVEWQNGVGPYDLQLLWTPPSSPASPFDIELGSAANYALLAASGITNTGTTIVTGGVIGSSPTPSITFDGGTATVDNADAAAAQSAVTTAVAYFNGLTYTSLSGSSVNLSTSTGGGGGAGVYHAGHYSAGSTMDAPTSITLDAQGNPNALFVFKASSSITFESGASVLLVNGAQPQNVVFLAGTTIIQTGNVGATINGTLIAGTQVTFGGGTFNGRAIAQTANITIAAAVAITVHAHGSSLQLIPSVNLSTSSTVITGTLTATWWNGTATTWLPQSYEVEFIGTSSGVFGNAQYAVPLNFQRNIAGLPTTISTFSQTYTTLSSNTLTGTVCGSAITWATGDIGAMTINTRPYIAGEVVGLNPRQSYYNSPDVPELPQSPSSGDGPWTAVVGCGCSSNCLPLGLSLDSHSGLIYGTLLGVFTGTSVIEYVGTTGIVHGIATINWLTVSSAFPVTSTGLDSIQMGTALTNSYITVPSNITPISASIYYIRGILGGTLPAGLTLSPTPSGQKFYITGTATEGGYFDVWFQVIASTGTAYLYHRLSIDFINPLIITTQSLPTADAGAYYALLQGFGGAPPYTWSSPNFPLGVGIGAFAGLSLNSSTGVINGTLTSPPVTSPTTLGDIQVTLTDSTGTSVTDGLGYQPTLDFIYNNGLRIVTATPWGVATVTNDTNGYSFQMQGAGGTPPYYWTISPPATLPGGIVFNSGQEFDTGQPIDGGWFSGTWTGAAYTPNPTSITVVLTDSVSGTNSKLFNIRTGTWTIGIAGTGVGPIPRGESYQGSLAATGTYTLPIQWEIAPTSGYPNLLPSGLFIQADGTGATATIAGTYSGSILTNSPVRVIAVDALGNTAENVLFLSTDTNLIVVGWDTVPTSGAIQPFPLPNAVITGSYGPIQLVAKNGVPLAGGVDGGVYGRYNWSSVPSFPFDGISLAGSGATAGQLSGTATTLFSQSFTFTVSDSLTPANTATYTTTFSSQVSGLTITTVTLPQAVAGTPYSFSLAASLGSPPYTFSIVGGALPSGLTMNSAGLITGTTLTLGTTPITFRVTDSTSAYSNKLLSLTTISGLVLKTGIDYEDSTSYGYLGYVDKGNVVGISPRTNLSFYVVATGVITTNPASLGIIVSGGFSVGTVTISGGVALIPLNGPFSSGTIGNSNPLSISVTDSGVTATGTFNWVVYDDGALRLAANNAFPVKLTTPN